MHVCRRTLTAAVDSGSSVALIDCMQYRHAPVCRVSSGSLGTAPSSMGCCKEEGASKLRVSCDFSQPGNIPDPNLCAGVCVPPMDFAHLT